MQRAVIEYLAWSARPDVFSFHYPAGGWRSKVEAKILKASEDAAFENANNVRNSGDSAFGYSPS
jgi:hypothetical protein